MRRLSFCILSALGFVAALGSGESVAQTYESIVQQRHVGGKVRQSERDEQEALFDYYFGDRKMKYETKLSNLKKVGSVPSWRIPYSAAIHPQSSGGMSDGGRGGRRRASADGFASGNSPLSLYDRAFNGGQNLANSYEVRRIMGTDRALFPALRMRRNSEPWEGYCSGVTASTIKHPEPVRAVDAGQVGGARGVVFQPSDIKAMLTCIYNRTTDDSFLYLAAPSARDGGPNMGAFHLAITNYISQAGCPVGIDTTKGEESWNYPIYAYSVNSIQDAGTSNGVHYQEVETTVTYTYYGSDAAMQTDAATGARRGNESQSKTFRYTLALDGQGRILGGDALSDSGHFLWLPLYAPQAKADATVQGNPYVDVRKVIAMARLSALPAMQKKFDEATIGPDIDPAVAKPADASKTAPTVDAAKEETPTEDAPKEDAPDATP
jgi:hypothetical protein